MNITGRPRFLFPGVGKGRIVRSLADYYSKKECSCDIIGIDPNSKLLDEIAIFLVNKDFKRQKTSSHNSTIYTKKGIKVELINDGIESYLEQYQEANGKFNAVLALLFIHYVTYSWLSILEKLVELLVDDGLIIFDKIVGADEENDLLLEAIDCRFERMEKLLQNNRAKIWVYYYLERLYEKGIFWCSVVKGTDIKLVEDYLGFLFEKQLSVCIPQKGHLAKTLDEQHLPWYWGTSEAEPSDLPKELKNQKLNIKFRFLIFKEKRKWSEETKKRIRSSTIRNSTLKAIENINLLRLKLGETEKPNYKAAFRNSRDSGGLSRLKI